jgi:hypothetical protein
MAHKKKRQRKQPSVIDSDLEHRFSAENDSDSTNQESDRSTTPTPARLATSV